MLNCINCNEKLQKIRTNTGVGIFQCRRCGLFVTDDVPIDTKHTYENLLESVRKVRVKNNKTNIDEILRLGLKKGFEVGCANGLFMTMAREYGIEMFGIEPMKNSCLVARAKGLNVTQGFFPEDTPLEVKGIDFVIFNDVFEHIKDSNAILEACKNLLCKGGYLIVNIPMSTGIIYRLGQILDKCGKGEVLRRLWQIDTLSPHVLYFNKKSIIEIAKRNGFDFKKKLRMQTFCYDDVKQRINAVDTKGMSDTAKKIYLIGAYIIFPFLRLLPADLETYYFMVR